MQDFPYKITDVAIWRLFKRDTTPLKKSLCVNELGAKQFEYKLNDLYFVITLDNKTTATYLSHDRNAPFVSPKCF